MKKILLGTLLFTLMAGLVRGQDDATQQQIDQMNNQIKELYGLMNKQNDRIAALERQVADLQDRASRPADNNYASRDDLKALAAQVQAVDKKRQEDRDYIVKQIEKSVRTPGSGRTASTSAPATGDGDASATPQTGYYYVVQPGDTLSAIAKAFRDSDKHVKVTAEQILKANPKLDAAKLVVGQKIFIPDPNAKP